MKPEQVQILANAAKNGDKNALNALYNEFCGSVCYFADIVFADERYSIETAFDVFSNLSKNIVRFDVKSDFKEFLFSIAYNSCAKRFPRKNGLISDEDEAVLDEASKCFDEYSPDSKVDKDELASIISNSVRTLGEERRAVVALCGFCDFDLKTAAKIQNVSEGTLKNRLDQVNSSLGMVCDKYFESIGEKCDSFLFPVIKWGMSFYYQTVVSETENERILRVAELLKEKNRIAFKVAPKNQDQNKILFNSKTSLDEERYSFIFCRNCGNRMKSGSTFCSKCGAKLKR